MKLYRLFICFVVLTLVQMQTFCADYLYKKLPSGQSVIVKEVKDNPVVTINTWVRTGSINEDDTNTGVAHFLEHLFFKGSKNVPSGEFDKILESKGAVTNAATSKDFTQFYITIPSKDFDLALKMHSDMLLNPLIPRNELEKERPVVLEEIGRGLDNPTSVLYNNLFKAVYSPSSHPYARPVIGTKEIISTISREKILEFYNEWYVPSNMITVVSGDVDANYAMAAIEKAFACEPAKNKTKKYPSIKQITSPIDIKAKADVAQGYMAIGYRAPKFTNARETYALDVLSIILGGSSSSVLNSELKEKKQLVNSIDTSYSQYMDDGLFIISSSFVEDKKDIVRNEIFDEIEKVKAGAITKEQVQKAKNILKTSTDYARESAANIANELGFFTLYFNSPKMYDEYLKQIDKVTVADVVAAANKFLDKNKTVTSTVMPANSSISLINNQNIAAAAKIIPDSAEVIEKTEFETKYLLDNGAILVVRKNKSNSIVAMDICAKGGSHITNKLGVPVLTAQNAKRGTQKYSFEELNNYLDDNGIRLSVVAHPDMFNISVMTTKAKLNDSLSVLDEVINRATFPNSEIDKTKRNYKEYVRSLKDRSLALATDEFAGVAYQGTVYANNNQKTVQEIDNVTREDLLGYYSKVLDSKNLVITVAGDVDDNKLIKEFNRIFEDKSSKKVEIKDFIAKSFVPSCDIDRKVANDGKETTWILIGYKTQPIYDIKELAVEKTVNSILGSGMSSRLFKSLREEQGLAYQVGSQVQSYANDSAFIAYIGTNFKNEEAAKRGILKEFHKIKTEFVPEKELQEAKDKLLGNMVLALETNMDRADFLSTYTSFGYNLNFLEELKKEIQNVTPTDILTYTNKYFSAPYIMITVGK